MVKNVNFTNFEMHIFVTSKHFPESIRNVIHVMKHSSYTQEDS